jgi:hypothetical protein
MVSPPPAYDSQGRFALTETNAHGTLTQSSCIAPYYAYYDTQGRKGLSQHLNRVNTDQFYLDDISFNNSWASNTSRIYGRVQKPSAIFLEESVAREKYISS